MIIASICGKERSNGATTYWDLNLKGLFPVNARVDPFNFAFVFSAKL